jgi:hypothetical protein
MSANGGAAGDDLALTQQVEAALRECTALTAALRRARRTRLLFLVLLIAFVGGVAWVFYGFFRPFVSDKFREELIAKAQDRFEQNSTLYQRELQLLFDNSRPVVEEAFGKQFKHDLPRFTAALDQQRDLFVKTLEAQVPERAQRHYDQLLALDRQRNTLLAEFPQFKDPKQQERMLKNIDVVVQRMVKHYYVDEMELQFRQLFDTWDKVPPLLVARDVQAADLVLPEMLEFFHYKLPRVVAAPQAK